MAPQRIKVLHTVCWTGVGGVQEHILQLIERLDRDRFEVLAAGPEGRYLELFAAAGAETHLVPMTRSWDLGSIRKLRGLVRGRGVDIVHAHLGISLMNSLLALAGLGAERPRVVFTEHFMSPWRTTLTNPVTQRAYALGHRWADRGIAAYVAVSGAVGRMLETHDRVSPEKISVIPNGVAVETYKMDPEARARLRAEWGVADHEPLVGALGRFYHEKGFDMLLEAASLLGAERGGVRFALMGDGPLREPLMEQSRRLGLEGRAVFPGFVEDIPAAMSALDFFALPSRSEGLGIVILEAMAMGLPVAATDSGGPAEVVVDGVTGRLTPVGDARAMAAALGDLIGDSARSAEMARSARKLVSERYDIGAIAARLGELYESVVEGRIGAAG